MTLIKFSSKLVVKSSLKIPPHLKTVAALPGKIHDTLQMTNSDQQRFCASLWNLTVYVESSDGNSWSQASYGCYALQHPAVIRRRYAVVIATPKQTTTHD